MNEITLARFHDILYRFFAVLACLGLFILSFDLITFASHHNLYMFRYELSGWENLLGIVPDMFMVFFGWYMAIIHKKKAKDAVWRNK